jgi:hypothetical protein
MRSRIVFYTIDLHGFLCLYMHRTVRWRKPVTDIFKILMTQSRGIVRVHVHMYVLYVPKKEK